MSLISELLSLREDSLITEAQLQSIVKKFSVPVGSIEKVFGEDAEKAAELLNAEVTDPVYELKGTDPQAVIARKSLVSQGTGGQREDDHGIQTVKLIGSRKVLIWNGRVLTSKEQFDSLVESTMVEADGDAAPHPLKGKISPAFNGLFAPFGTGHTWVNDGKGVSVCDARDPATAKEIAKHLNAAYPHPRVKATA